MAKKNFDNFLNTVTKSPKPSPEEIEEMTKEVHDKSRPKTEIRSEKNIKKAAATKQEQQEKGRRGRKPKPPENERMIRVSVDLPESVIIDLKARVIRQQTDMKNFIRRMVEAELGR
jgi:hypothetical protein